ncbi:nucleotide exchange factor GrpE [Salinispora sp. H7-4]|uniref:nucleotide exchange factor GrpE n=1 Tax=Salinispora sp. H7-4 TaxID=2748321 RepID=UPI0015D258AB|nr:nucleotide exchange factor GrpE [Salinispora sp. H7-4]NYT96760.1 nucleotide exchange factor GrpE [Salinispora sp. H7-4]
MTDKPRATDPDAAGSVPGGSASAGEAGAEPRVVIRDNRKISDATGSGSDTADAESASDATSTGSDAAGSGSDAAGSDAADAAAADAGSDVPAAGLVEEADVVVDEIQAETTEGASASPPVVDAPAEPVDAATATSLGAELEALRVDLDERTRDLQRVTAEYANYRKRVDRDRALVTEQATGSVLAALLPILDDLDRAREHGDLVGPFGSVAEQLTTALGKFGLTPFGAEGDPFDPTQHEAVTHRTSAEVTEPTCVQVMRRGYLVGERLLRPALVGVAEPE